MRDGWGGYLKLSVASEFQDGFCLEEDRGLVPSQCRTIYNYWNPSLKVIRVLHMDSVGRFKIMRALHIV